MNRIVAIFCLFAAAGVLFWFFPLFHVVSRDAQRAEREQAAFSAAAFAEEFWITQLLPALDKADNAAAVLAALRENPAAAREQFGRSAGLGRASLYVVRGSGTIVSVDNKAVGVSLDGAGGEPEIALAAGLLFGNTVRDATGLLDAGEFANSQHFNDVSTELSRIVETRVIPPLKAGAAVGRRIEFAGCAEVISVPRDVTPLKVIPLEVEFK